MSTRLIALAAIVVACTLVLLIPTPRPGASEHEMRNLEGVVYVQGREIERQRQVIVALANLQRTESDTVGTIIDTQRSELRSVAMLARGQGYAVTVKAPTPKPKTALARSEVTPRVDPPRHLTISGGG